MLTSKTKKCKTDLEKLLLRAKLDRPSMIQEKFRIIWKEQDGSAIAAAAAAAAAERSQTPAYSKRSEPNSEKTTPRLGSQQVQTRE